LNDVGKTNFIEALGETEAAYFRGHGRAFLVLRMMKDQHSRWKREGVEKRGHREEGHREEGHRDENPAQTAA
jgi:hypothetical protein